METYDVIIVGAGLSGLAAGVMLHRSGKNILLLEARGRVGGRTFTVKDPHFGSFDLGGSFVGPNQHRMLSLIKEFNIKTSLNHQEGQYSHVSQGQVYHYTVDIPDVLEEDEFFSKLGKDLEQVPLEKPWMAENASLLDNMSVEDWIQQRNLSRAAAELCRIYISMNFAREASQVSMLYVLWIVKNSGAKQCWETSGGIDERFLQGGSMQVAECLAESLKDSLRLNTPVTRIRQTADLVFVETEEDEIFQARRLILSTPPNIMAKLTLDPALPPICRQRLNSIPMGWCIKNVTLYKKPFWRENGFNGSCTCADGTGAISSCVDATCPGAPFYTLMGFLLSDMAKKASELTREERKALTIQYYAKIFESDEALEPVAYREVDWNKETYSGGCYSNVYPPGVFSKYGRELSRPFGKIHFASTEAATRWQGFMEGAILSGERAAEEILAQNTLSTEERGPGTS